MRHWPMNTLNMFNLKGLPSLFIYLFIFCFLGLHPWHVEAPRPGGPVGATASSLSHSHSNVGSELRLQPTTQPATTLDPRPTEQGQGSNPHPLGHQSDLLPLHHSGNSLKVFQGYQEPP